MTMNYREVKRKAAVGERIKIVAAEDAGSYYKNGDVLTVSNADRWATYSGQAVSVKEFDYAIRHSEYVVLEPLTSDPLYAGGSLLENFRQFVADNAPALRKLLDEVDPEPTVVTATALPKLTRADVIAKARADVAELLAQNHPDVGGEGAWFAYAGGAFITDRAEFVVNREKRTVTALIRYVDDNKVWRKATAKCSPADVFHADLGRVIALRKALGLSVPDEYVNAPKPDEPCVGAVVAGGVVHAVRPTHRTVGGGAGFAFYGHKSGYTYIGEDGYERWSHIGGAEILDDTDVDYSGLIAAGGAGHPQRMIGAA